MVLEGTFQLKGNGSSSASSTSSLHPPKAIFLKLSDAALVHLKSLYAAGNVPDLNVELGAAGTSTAKGENTPTAFTIGESSYAISRRANPSDLLTTDLVSSGSTTNKSSSKALDIVQHGCKDSYSLGAVATARRALIEKTAENMGERIRERHQQLEREKESRRVVVMDEDPMLHGKDGKGKKGKGGKASSQATASPLFRAQAIAAKRSPSPAATPRGSPVVGAAGSPLSRSSSTMPRPPSRLIANEAAKNLIKSKKETVAPQVAPSVASAQTDVQTVETNPQTFAPTEKKRMLSSASSTSSHSTTTTASTLSTSATSITSNTVSTGTTNSVGPAKRKSPSPSRSTSKHPVLSSPPQIRKGNTQRRREDDSDLASSSSSDDLEDTIPLAKRVTSPVKAPVPSLPAPAASVPGTARADVDHPPPLKKAKTSPTAAKIASSSSTSTAIKASTTKAGALLPPPPATLSTRPGSASSRSPSPDGSSSSSASGAPLASTLATTSKKSKALGPASAVIESAREKGRSASPAGSKANEPRTAAKTAGGARLSKPIPKRPGTSTPVPLSPQVQPADVSPKNKTSVEKTNATILKEVASSTRPAGTPTLAVDSKAGSPKPSPTLHPLPAKPTASPSISHTKSPKLQPIASTASYAGGMSEPPSPNSRSTYQSSSARGAKVPPLGAGLPPKPQTIIPPYPRSASSSSHNLAPPSSGLTSGGNSPIISNFPKRDTTAMSPKAASRDVSLASDAGSKKRKSDSTDLDRNSVTDTKLKSKKVKLNLREEIAFTSSEEEGEEGEADEDGEGEEEEDAEAETDPNEGEIVETEEVPRGRSTDKKSTSNSGRNGLNGSHKRISDTAMLPAFKKGRASELLASEGARDGSLSRSRDRLGSQNVSRAPTPASIYAPIRDDSPHAFGLTAKGPIKISSDEDFERFSMLFSDDLFPTYSKLRKTLEDVQKALINKSKKSSTYSTTELEKMVEEANERGKQLEAIRMALSKYAKQKEAQL